MSKRERLPNDVDWFMGKLAAYVTLHPDDENVLDIVREALAKIDALNDSIKPQPKEPA